MDKLVQIFMALTTRYTEGQFSVSSVLVNLTLQRDGIQRAREMYKRYVPLSFLGTLTVILYTLGVVLCMFF